MRTSLIAILSAVALSTPVHAESVPGGILEGLGESSPQSRPAPPVSTPDPNRFGYPDYDPTARRVGDTLCFAYIKIGASRTTDICIPTRNFADTLEPRPDMSSQSFAGNTVETEVEQLAKCRIRRRADPGLGTAPTTDPSIGYQLEVRCPSRREGGGSYTLNVAFNRDYYLAYRLVDTICGPDQAKDGSEFDQYVRSTLGEPSRTNTRGDAITRYEWVTNDTGIALIPDARSGNGTCTNPTSSQINWSGRIWIADRIWNAFDTYLGGLTQQQRDSGFTRF
jgi:hypothetical protein